MFHWRTTTGSARILARDESFECGILTRSISASHSLTSAARYCATKGPRYEIEPAQTSTSPTMAVSCSPSASTVSCHALASPPSPPMSLSALKSCTWQRSTCSSSCAILSIAACSSASSCATFSLTALSLASAAFRLAVAAFSSDSALASFCRLGSTSSAT